MSPPPLDRASTSFDDRFDDLAATAHRVAYRIVGSREDARDIAQEALTRAFVRWNKVEPSADAWVARVATNLALDHARYRARRQGRPVKDGPPVTPADPERLDLVAALRALPRRQRDVVILRYVADLPEAEVARALGLAPGTVKSHASRGLAALRTTIDLNPYDAPSADASTRPLGAR